MNTKIRTRGGSPIVILGRRSIQTYWARRLSDNALRYYSPAELLHDDGAEGLLRELAVIPMMRRARALVALTDSILAHPSPATATAERSGADRKGVAER